MGCGQYFGWMVMDLERKWLKNWLERNLGKRYYMNRQLWIGQKKMWIYLCPLWILTKGWPQQKGILIIKWMGWWPILWIPVSLFAQPHLSSTNELMSKVAMVSGIEFMHGHSNKDFHSPRSSLLWPSLNAQSAHSRDKHWVPDMVPFHISASYLVADWLHWTAFITEETVFCSYWNSYSRYRFAFPAHYDFAKTIIHRHTWNTMYKAIHHHGIPYNIISDWGTLHRKRSVSTGPCS